MPAEIRGASDPIEPALWIGQRIRRFKPIVGHSWFEAIFGKMAAGMSPWRIAKWLSDELPEDDPLRAEGFDALHRRLRHFQRAMPESVRVARSYLDEKYAAIGAGIDVLQEMDKLIRYQKDRISNKISVEDEFPLPMEQMRREVDELKELLVARVHVMEALNLIPNAKPVANVQIIGRQLVDHRTMTITQILDNEPSKIPAAVDLMHRLSAVLEAPSGSGALVSGVEPGSVVVPEQPVRLVDVGRV